MQECDGTDPGPRSHHRSHIRVIGIMSERKYLGSRQKGCLIPVVYENSQWVEIQDKMVFNGTSRIPTWFMQSYRGIRL